MAYCHQWGVYVQLKKEWNGLRLNRELIRHSLIHAHSLTILREKLVMLSCQ